MFIKRFRAKRKGFLLKRKVEDLSLKYNFLLRTNQKSAWKPGGSWSPLRLWCPFTGIGLSPRLEGHGIFNPDQWGLSQHCNNTVITPTSPCSAWISLYYSVPRGTSPELNLGRSQVSRFQTNGHPAGQWGSGGARCCCLCYTLAFQTRSTDFVSGTRASCTLHNPKGSFGTQ